MSEFDDRRAWSPQVHLAPVESAAEGQAFGGPVAAHTQLTRFNLLILDQIKSIQLWFRSGEVCGIVVWGS